MPGPSDAQKSVEEFQRLLVLQGGRASSQVLNAYAPVYRQLQNNTQALVKVAQTRGLKPWQVMRMQRMKDLEQEFLASASKFADIAGSRITDSQRAAVGLARRGAEQTVVAGLPRGVTMENLANIGLGWNRLPEEAFTNFVGIAADGNPVSNLLAPLGREAAGGVKDAIGTGIALGKGPRQTAQLVRVAAGMPLSKALLITRTETNRAFREATRLDYANNSQVVKGYRRLAAHSERTCMACIALDGTLYALDEPLNEHPNGRCALVPDTITYQDLGLDVEMPPQPENARDWLTRQPEDTQRNMLGNARFEAIQRGELHMNQLATVRQNAIWGDAAVVRPLRDLGLREGVPVRPPMPPPPRPTTPTPSTPPVRPAGDLVDPQTNLPVRGTRTAPPDIDDMTALGKAYDSDIPLQWEVVGNKMGFLDTNPASMIAPTDKALVTRMIKEQEAWARAVGGAIEVDYEGMSILAARQTNLALEKTIVRHNIRPLERVITRPLPGDTFDSAYAYMTRQGGVHINTATMENGSVRALGKKNAVDNALIASRNAASRESVGKTAEILNRQTLNEIATKRLTLEAQQKQRIEYIRQQRAAGLIDEASTQAQIRFFEAAIKENKQLVKRWETALNKQIKVAKKQELKISANQHSTTREASALEDIVTHEIGHYYHRRFGFNDTDALSVLSRTSRRRADTGYAKAYDRKGEWTGRRAAGDDAYAVSEYAATNDREFFAESFANYYQGGDRITKKMSDFIEEVIKANTENPLFTIDETNAIGLNARRKGVDMRMGAEKNPLRLNIEYPSDRG